MDQRTTAIYGLALDALQLRAQATAQNIANANSDSYKPLAVDFERALREAATSGPIALHGFQPTVTQSREVVHASQQRIDLELATASETALRYSALIDIMGREFSLQRTMIRGGQ